MAVNKKKPTPIRAQSHAPGEWEDEIDGDYNPADFVYSATDHQGHSERVYCRIQPQYARALNVIYRSKKFPFRTEGDLFRWALMRGIKVLDRLEPMPSFLGAADAINEIVKQHQYLQEFTLMFGSMEQIINAYAASGDNGEARKLLAVVLQKVRSIDEDHWKTKCEAEVMRRFGHLLDTKTKAKLMPSLQADLEGRDG